MSLSKGCISREDDNFENFFTVAILAQGTHRGHCDLAGLFFHFFANFNYSPNFGFLGRGTYAYPFRPLQDVEIFGNSEMEQLGIVEC